MTTTTTTTTTTTIVTSTFTNMDKIFKDIENSERVPTLLTSRQQGYVSVSSFEIDCGCFMEICQKQQNHDNEETLVSSRPRQESSLSLQPQNSAMKVVGDMVFSSSTFQVLQMISDGLATCPTHCLLMDSMSSPSMLFCFKWKFHQEKDSWCYGCIDIQHKQPLVFANIGKESEVVGPFSLSTLASALEWNFSQLLQVYRNVVKTKKLTRNVLRGNDFVTISKMSEDQVEYAQTFIAGLRKTKPFLKHVTAMMRHVDHKFVALRRYDELSTPKEKDMSNPIRLRDAGVDLIIALADDSSLLYETLRNRFDLLQQLSVAGLLCHKHRKTVRRIAVVPQWDSTSITLKESPESRASFTKTSRLSVSALNALSDCPNDRFTNAHPFLKLTAAERKSIAENPLMSRFAPRWSQNGGTYS